MSSLLSAPPFRRLVRRRLVNRQWPVGPMPPSRAVVRAPGASPLQVLLLGGGIVTGYGTTNHEVALAGHLARQLAHAAERGVDMDISVELHVTVADALLLARNVNADDYDVVVLGVGIRDALDGANPRRWGEQVGRLMDYFDQQDSSPQVFVISVPDPVPATELSRVARFFLNQRAGLYNRELRNLASGRDNVTVLPFTPPISGTEGGAYDSDTYRAWAHQLSPLIARNLPADRAHSDQPMLERTRHDALTRLAIMDTAPDRRYDDVVALARRRFHVAAAAIGFVDEDREWFKSISGAALSSIPRDASFCDWTVRTKSPLVVADARIDDRFKQRDIVTKGGMRWYAGHPILDPTGVPIGAICVLDPQPREFSGDDAAFLRKLASLVEALLLTPAAA